MNKKKYIITIVLILCAFLTKYKLTNITTLAAKKNHTIDSVSSQNKPVSFAFKSQRPQQQNKDNNKKKPKVFFSHQTKQKIIHYANMRHTFIFKSSYQKAASGLVDDDIIHKVYSFFLSSWKQQKYNSNNEKLRIALISYLEDAAYGLLPSQDPQSALNQIISLLEIKFNDSEQQARQLQSIIADYIDLISAWSSLDGDSASNYLKDNYSNIIYSYLKTGYHNGKYLLKRQ